MEKEKIRDIVGSELMISHLQNAFPGTMSDLEDSLVEALHQAFSMSVVSGSTFTIDDMKKAFMAGADKKYWTKIHLTGVVSGEDYVLEPVFEKWFEYYR